MERPDSPLGSEPGPSANLCRCAAALTRECLLKSALFSVTTSLEAVSGSRNGQISSTRALWMRALLCLLPSCLEHVQKTDRAGSAREDRDALMVAGVCKQGREDHNEEFPVSKQVGFRGGVKECRMLNVIDHDDIKCLDKCRARMEVVAALH